MKLPTRLYRLNYILFQNTHKVLLKNVVNSYLADAYDVPCRSIKLNEELPEISRIIRNIPEFEAEEICSVPRKTGACTIPT